MTRKLMLAALMAALVLIGGGSVGANAPLDSFDFETAGAGDGLLILLTNDDGIGAEGISAMYTALSAAGHQVVVVAPKENQSGSGARLTLSDEVTVKHYHSGIVAITATPADAVEFGLSNIFAFDAIRPDVVISGINAGANVGAGTVHSGTVGAAVTAINEGVPAIAVSQDTLGTFDYRRAADFAVELVDHLDAHRQAGEPLLPAGSGLNVNVPAGAGPHVGKVYTQTGRGWFDQTFDSADGLPGPGEERTYEIVPTVLNEVVSGAVDTRELFENRKITITPISGNYDTTAQWVFGESPLFDAVCELVEAECDR